MKKLPNSKAIQEAWLEYDHAIAFEKLIDFKYSDHGYVCLAWEEYGMIYFADLYRVGKDHWEFANDCNGPYTLEEWNKAKLIWGNDWLNIGKDTLS